MSAVCSSDDEPSSIQVASGAKGLERQKSKRAHRRNACDTGECRASDTSERMRLEALATQFSLHRINLSEQGNTIDENESSACPLAEALFWTTALDAMDEESGTLHKPSKRHIHSFDGEVTTQRKSRFRSKVIIPQISQSMLCGAHESAEAHERRMEMESVINQR